MIKVSMEMYGFPHAAGPELDRLAAGPGASAVGAMEAALMAGFATSQGRVHVITGQLKASLQMGSSFAGDTWTGTMSAARYPGIFELARGNMPTDHHPSGGHYFFGPGGQEFERSVRETVWEWVTGGEGGAAPSEGLSWKSGG